MVKKSDDVKMSMVVAAVMALDYKDEHEKAEIGEILQYIMEHMHVQGDEKVGAIVGANKALKEKSSGESNKVIVQGIMDKADEILMTIGEE